MSTRCNIIIKEKDKEPIYVYHHFDGYPEGVGSELKKILSTEYTNNTISAKEIEQFLYDYDTQYEKTDSIHGDIEYLYILTVVDNNIINYKCIDVPFDLYVYETLDNCELIEECDIHIPYSQCDSQPAKQYPTVEQGISFIMNNIWNDHMSKDEIVDMLKTFYDYVNTPFE